MNLSFTWWIWVLVLVTPVLLAVVYWAFAEPRMPFPDALLTMLFAFVMGASDNPSVSRGARLLLVAAGLMGMVLLGLIVWIITTSMTQT